jgi:histidine decarboxylase
MTNTVGDENHRANRNTDYRRSGPSLRSSFQSLPDQPPTAAEPRWQLPFPLGDGGLSEHQRAQTLAGYRDYIHRQVQHFLGYQANQHAGYSSQLSWMLDHHVNNLGDPFTQGNFTVNSKEFERDVLDYYARLWHAKTPHRPNDGDSYWGYVLTMGSTEGNLYGLWNARDYLKGRALVLDPQDPTRLLWVSATTQSTPEDPDTAFGATTEHPDLRNRNAFTPTAFYSADTHYSFTKAVRVLGIQTFSELGKLLYPDECPLGDFWPDEVPSVDGDHGPGSIDIDKLCTLVEFFAARGHPALISLNVGTTFKGAYDPVAEIEPRIVQIMRKHGLYERILQLPHASPTKRHGFWIHVDGALGAAYLPYLRMAKERGDTRLADVSPIPEFDFAITHVFSIAMSGHKWIGAPWPCGIYMTKVKYQLRPPAIPVYTGSPDTTFAGSRNGLSSVALWEHLARYTQAEQLERAAHAQELAAYTESALVALAGDLGRNLYVARTPLALTVRFLKPHDSLIFKYSLSTETFRSDQSIDYAHLFVMPGITKQLIDELVDDLRKPGAFPAPSQLAMASSISPETTQAAVGTPEFAGLPADVVHLVGGGFQ